MTPADRRRELSRFLAVWAQRLADESLDETTTPPLVDRFGKELQALMDRFTREAIADGQMKALPKKPTGN